MTQTTLASIPDVQNRADQRGIPLDLVGVRDIRFPIVVLDRAEAEQRTIASINMAVSLPHHFKGTHMSRFIEALNDHPGELTMRTIPTLLADLRERLQAERAHLTVEFPYFMTRVAPASRATALMDYNCTFAGELADDAATFTMTVEVPVTSLCPCSKEISEYGAHNQRGVIRMEVRSLPDEHGTPHLIWIEELVDLAEGAASAPVYPLLKRADERHVTMQAYDNPRFVEDMVREVVKGLRADARVAWCRVQAVNQESIHNHNAFARVEWLRPSSASATH
jgi:GTP cyclohydrolase I